MSLLAELQGICGADHAAPATRQDAVLGSTPSWVVRPRTTEDVARVLGFAADERLRTVVRGAGSKLDWGPAPHPVDMVLDTTRLAGVLAHQPDQSQATVRAGSRLDTLAERFAASGQRLALDPPGPTTVGGTLATATSVPVTHTPQVPLLIAALGGDPDDVGRDQLAGAGNDAAGGDVAGGAWHPPGAWTPAQSTFRPLRPRGGRATRSAAATWRCGSPADAPGGNGPASDCRSAC